MESWSQKQNTDCVICGSPRETRNHLFFECSYARNIWKIIMSNFLGQKFRWDWDGIIALLHHKDFTRTQQFLLRYTFQAAIYHIWRERNNRRHGEAAISWTSQAHIFGKNVKNKISSHCENGLKKYEHDLRISFATQGTTT
ncbi:hypothetical protein N665_11039s0001 [Sinapis alba]|nr:hypothetical protein N665_11039s0001 [Sinapis alba]